jgi:hypothetical protein
VFVFNFCKLQALACELTIMSSLFFLCFAIMLVFSYWPLWFCSFLPLWHHCPTFELKMEVNCWFIHSFTCCNI